MAALERIDAKEVQYIVSLSQTEVAEITNILGNACSGAEIYTFFRYTLKGGKKKNV